MYSFLEIETIFDNCKSWLELEKACKAFLWVLADGDLTGKQRLFIKILSQKRFREIEKL